MKMTIKITLVATAIATILTGCGQYTPGPSKMPSTADTPSFTDKFLENSPDKVVLNIGKSKKDLKVYVDNSKDIKRAQVVMDKVYFALKEARDIEVPIEQYEIKDKDAEDIGWLEPIGQVLVDCPKKRIVKYRCYLGEECKKMRLSQYDIEYTNGKIIINDFKTDREIISGYSQIINQYFNIINKPLHAIYKEYGVMIPVQRGAGSFENKRLELTNELLLAYSMKKELEEVIERDGMKVVNNESDADVVLRVENLAYTQLKLFKHMMKNYGKRSAFSNFSASIAPAIGMRVAGGGGSGAALGAGMLLVGGALDLASNKKHPQRIIPINNVEIINKRDNSYNKVSLIIAKETDSESYYRNIGSESAEVLNRDISNQLVFDVLDIREN